MKDRTEYVGFPSGVAEVLIFLGHDTASLAIWYHTTENNRAA